MGGGLIREGGLLKNLTSKGVLFEGGGGGGGLNRIITVYFIYLFHDTTLVFLQD